MLSRRFIRGFLLIVGLMIAVEGCPSPKHLPAKIGRYKLCARLYDRSSRSCGGRYMDVFDDMRKYSMGYWNDRASALVVRPGCRLDVHEDPRYRGKSYRFGSWWGVGTVVGSLDRLTIRKGRRCKGFLLWRTCRNYRVSWDNAISSLICTCKPYK